MSLLVAIVAASLVGSLHCAGMCGPLVAFAVGSSGERSWRARAALQGAYHGGRAVTYGLVGAISGALGATINLAMMRVGVFHAAAFLAGGMMLVAGGGTLLRTSGVRIPAVPMPAAMRRLIAAGQRGAMAMAPMPRALVIGLLTALLPCGWLYLFAVMAAGTGSMVSGTAVMLAFWLGSLPALIGVGIGVQTLGGALGRRAPLVMATAIMVLGLATIAWRMTVPMEAFAEPPRATSETAEQLRAATSEVPPCCRTHQKPSESR